MRHRLLPACLLACLLALTLGTVGCASLDPISSEGDGVVSGVYIGRFNQQFQSTEIVIELNQRGRRVAGTYTLRAGGSLQEGRVSGLYTEPTLQLEFSDPDRPAEFVGTVSEDGDVIEGQYSVDMGGNYTVTLRRD